LCPPNPSLRATAAAANSSSSSYAEAQQSEGDDGGVSETRKVFYMHSSVPDNVPTGNTLDNTVVSETMLD
jgi:hypothetical protein